MDLWILSDRAQALAVSPDGTKVFVTGWVVTGSVFESEGDYGTVAYDVMTGEELWASSYDGPRSDWLDGDRAMDIAVSPDGNRVFVTGDSTSLAASAASIFATVAYDAETGEQIWAKRYDAPGGGQDTPEDITVSPNGNIVVITGSINQGAGQGDWGTVAYRAGTGERLWVKRYLGPGESSGIGVGVAFSPDSRTAYVVGSGDGLNHDLEIITFAYRAGSGSTRWKASFDGRRSTRHGAIGLVVSPNGNKLFVIGATERVSTGADHMVVAYRTATGAELWAVRHDRGTGDDDIATDIAIAPDGETIFVTGTTRRTQTYYDYYTVAYRAGSGSVRWAKRYDGPAPASEDDYDTAWAIAVSPDGTRVYVTGQSPDSLGGGSFPSPSYATIAYSAGDGMSLWTRRYDGDGLGGSAFDIATSPDGSLVFVTGESFFMGESYASSDYVTVAYDAG